MTSSTSRFNVKPCSCHCHLNAITRSSSCILISARSQCGSRRLIAGNFPYLISQTKEEGNRIALKIYIYRIPATNQAQQLSSLDCKSFHDGRLEKMMIINIPSSALKNLE